MRAAQAVLLLLLAAAACGAPGVIVMGLKRKAMLPKRKRKAGLVPPATAQRRHGLDEAKLLSSEEGHYVEAYIGTPPQKASLVIDTGSATTVLPCSSCSNCGTHANKPFDPQLSTTVRTIGCGTPDCTIKTGHTCVQVSATRLMKGGRGCGIHLNSGGPQPSRAVVLRDTLFLGQSQHTPDFEVGTLQEQSTFRDSFVFTCEQDDEAGMLKLQHRTDGIMGFADREDTLVPSLVRAGVLAKRMFSLCFSKKGGLLVLGGIDVRTHHSPTGYTPIVNAQDLGAPTADDSVDSADAPFMVRLVDVHVGDRSIGTPLGPPVLPSMGGKQQGFRKAVLDSGSTQTFFPSDLAPKIVAAFTTVKLVEHPVPMSQAEVDAMPTITLHFARIPEVPKAGHYPATLAVHPKDYMEAGQCLDSAKKEVCWRPRFRLDDPSGASVTIGTDFMTDNDVIFDALLSRVGFARANCHEDDIEVTPGSMKVLMRSCPVGRYGNRHTGRCIDCELGKFSGGIGERICETCPAGKFVNYARSVECFFCPPGKFGGEAGATACGFCPKDTMQPKSGQVACEPCPLGETQPKYGASVCLWPTICKKGTYATWGARVSNSTAALVKRSMGLGKLARANAPVDPTYVNTHTGIEHCTLCPAGRYQDQTGELQCKPCSKGRYSAAGELAPCAKRCAPGTFSAGGRWECAMCPRGRFTAAWAASACGKCPAGKYTGVRGMVRCALCGPGVYASAVAATGCVKCGTGRYVRRAGQTRCQLCEPGRYAPRRGATACLKCIAGWFATSWANYACALCTSGHFSKSAAGKCPSCPLGKYQMGLGKSGCTPCATFERLLSSSMHVTAFVAQAIRPRTCDRKTLAVKAAARAGAAKVARLSARLERQQAALEKRLAKKRRAANCPPPPPCSKPPVGCQYHESGKTMPNGCRMFPCGMLDCTGSCAHVKCVFGSGRRLVVTHRSGVLSASKVQKQQHRCGAHVEMPKTPYERAHCHCLCY